MPMRMRPPLIRADAAATLTFSLILRFDDYFADALCRRASIAAYIFFASDSAMLIKMLISPPPPFAFADVAFLLLTLRHDALS